MNFSYYVKEKLLPILVNRTAIFFFLMCLLTLFLYVVGTVQGFIDSTQLALLRLYAVLGIFLTIASVYGAALALERLVKLKKNRYLLRAGGYFFLIVFGILSVLMVLLIIILSKGNAGS